MISKPFNKTPRISQLSKKQDGTVSQRIPTRKAAKISNKSSFDVSPAVKQKAKEYAAKMRAVVKSRLASSTTVNKKSSSYPSSDGGGNRKITNSTLKQKAKDYSVAARAKKKKPRKTLPFCSNLSQSVQQGRTTASFRLNLYSFYPKAGEQFMAYGENETIQGVYYCSKRTRTTLGVVVKNHWKAIGLPSPKAYQELMKEILHVTELDLSAMGHLFFFERVE